MNWPRDTNTTNTGYLSSSTRHERSNLNIYSRKVVIFSFGVLGSRPNNLEMSAQFPLLAITMRHLQFDMTMTKNWHRVSMQEVSRRADILRFVCTNAMLAKTRDSASRVDTNETGSRLQLPSHMFKCGQKESLIFWHTRWFYLTYGHDSLPGSERNSKQRICVPQIQKTCQGTPWDPLTK